MIGTTDSDHVDASKKPECSEAESDYLRAFASKYFKQPVTKDDVVWSYSGVRPLYDDGASSATAATRDYVLKVNQDGGAAPLLNVFGGKITTYRKLADSALAKITPFFPKAGPDWTASVSLPGGDFPVDGVATLIQKVRENYPFLDDFWARRLVRAYGTDAWLILGDTMSTGDMGIAYENRRICSIHNAARRQGYLPFVRCAAKILRARIKTRTKRTCAHTVVAIAENLRTCSIPFSPLRWFPPGRSFNGMLTAIPNCTFAAISCGKQGAQRNCRFS